MTKARIQLQIEIWQRRLQSGANQQMVQRLNIIIIVSGLSLIAQWPATYMPAVSRAVSEDQLGRKLFAGNPATYAALRIVSRIACLFLVMTMLLATLLVLELQAYTTRDGRPPPNLTAELAGRLARIHTVMSNFFLSSFVFAGLGFVMQTLAFESTAVFVITTGVLALSTTFIVFAFCYIRCCKNRVEKVNVSNSNPC